MLVVRVSPVSGKRHVRQVDVTEAQYSAWQEGFMLVQEAFPQLSADDREFLVSGITPEEWKEMCSSED